MELDTRLEGLSTGELAREIMDGFREWFGVDLEATFNDETLTERERLGQGRIDLVKALLVRLQGAPVGKAMAFRYLTPRDFLDMAADVEFEPSLVVTPDALAAIKTYRGDRTLTYLKQLTRCLAGMTRETDLRRLARVLASTGMIGVGVGREAVATYRAGATCQEAALAGVRDTGITAIVVTLALIVVGILFWLARHDRRHPVIHGTEFALTVRPRRPGYWHRRHPGARLVSATAGSCHRLDGTACGAA